MLAWLPSRPTAVSVHSPLTVSRPRTVRPRSVKKRDRGFEVADGDADVLEFDGHALHVIEAGDSCRSAAQDELSWSSDGEP